jgi:sugar/nucleoside kinase (ribokinase family)
MQAFFIGQTYIDVTFLTDRLPTGDEKHVASAYAVSFGGNAVTAAFCCAKLSIAPALLTTVADDWLGRMFLEMAAKYEIKIHPRNVRTSSLSFIMPKAGQRAIVRCRDDDHLNSFPVLDLDGGGLRSNTHELLSFIDVAVVAERLCEQMSLAPAEMLEYLKGRGCRVGGVTLGERGLLWYDETGAVRSTAALAVPPERILDTSGAGDIFHGAYLYSYLAAPTRTWAEHFKFARAAAAHKIQHLGNEAGLPALQDIEAIRREYEKPP